MDCWRRLLVSLRMDCWKAELENGLLEEAAG